MSNNQARTKFDPIAALGCGFPGIITLSTTGNIAAYVSGLDTYFASPQMSGDNDNALIRVSDYQMQYGTQGAGGSGSDTYRLQLIDQTADVLGAGTISATTTAVTGVGTAFLTQFAVGNLLRASGQTMLITAIADNTHLTIEVAPTAPWAGVAYYQVPFISTIATVLVPANVKFVAPVTVLTAKLLGSPIKAGQGVRLDSAGIGTGYGTSPAAPKFRLNVETYGIAA